MMIKTSKRALAACFVLIFAVAMVALPLHNPALAEEHEGSSAESLTDKKIELLKEAAPPEGDAEAADAEADVDADEQMEGEGVHADPGTFQKNFLLSPAQKAWTIPECEKVVDEILTDDMSDLEKYYTLAVWVNKHVEYDWEFWKGRYHFEYYSHQWDAYGAMKGRGVEKSVCVGIAIFYSNMCHAAGLPCKFARTIPKNLDHTINYIPDINGHAYYVDVTENMFLMSDKSNPFMPIDTDFSEITKEPANYSFDYIEKEEYTPSALKDDEGNYKTYDQWFEEFAQHKNTKKRFVEDYVELGSGESGKHCASYQKFEQYPPQPYFEKYTSPQDYKELRPIDAVTGTWFLDDFYENPADMKGKILANQFDDQLLDISGVKENYDFDPEDPEFSSKLAAAVSEDISISYFPTAEDGEVVAKAAGLTKGTDYTVTASLGDTANTARITISAAGDKYQGQCEFEVKINSAVVTKAPTLVNDLVYDGTSKKLVEPGEAENGVMQYAIGSKETIPAEGAFNDEIPEEVNAGSYYIWYRVEGVEGHAGVEPQCVALPVTIAPIQVGVLTKNLTITVGETGVISPSLDRNIPARFTFINITPNLISLTDDGVVKGLKAGHAMVFVDAELKYGSSNYAASDYNMAVVNVVKLDNPMSLKAKTAKIKAKALKKKAKKVKQAKAFTVKNAKGTLSFKLVSAKKGGKNFKKKFRVNAKTGQVTVKKGLKKGTYKVTVKVRAKGDATYQASTWKKVTFKVKIK